MTITTFKILIACLLMAFLYIWQVGSHGKLMDPVSRSSAWRKNFNTPKNFNDNELYCGGYYRHYGENKGKCGPCGDDWSDPQPRDNENRGKYGQGKIVRRYRRGQRINIQVELDANHLGYFEFSLCPLKRPRDIETEECFAAHPISIADNKLRYNITEDMRGFLTIPVTLPNNINCTHCTLRWHYYCGNNWGFCDDGTDQQGCGLQEYFRGCADVSIR